MFERLKRYRPAAVREEEFQAALAKLREHMPVPVLWLFGKTQSGKTTLVKYLTGAENAEVGQGFRPCTRFSRAYDFPTAEAPLVKFLDTRGMDEAGYDPKEDLGRFNDTAHVLIVTVKLLDYALENLRKHLGEIRQAAPARPVLLVLTCLHEAYPQQQHPMSYPFDDDAARSDDGRIQVVKRHIAEHRAYFEELVDRVVAVDLTPIGEGFNDPTYGGATLKHELVELLPEGYRQVLLTMETMTEELQDLFARRALPHIAGYSSLAATAGAFPIPWLDLLILPGIQARMIYHVAQLYGQPLSGPRFLELAGTLGLGILFRQGLRELMKLIPYVGSMASGALAGASTFALGKAFCYYYSAVHKGHVPRADELKRYYREQLHRAQESWALGKGRRHPSSARTAP